jgi:membrane-associated protease RseP (regulator of RpoE activity)
MKIISRILCVSILLFPSIGPSAAASLAQTQATKSSISSAVTIASTPPGAEIFVDQNFVGNTPSSVGIATGKHWISVRKVGFEEWRREVTFSGGDVNLIAELVKEMSAPPSAATRFANVKPIQPRAAIPTDSSEINGRNAKPTPAGWLGASGKRGNSGGFEITSLIPNGPAEEAGLKMGDEILKLNEKVLGPGDLESQLSAFANGSKVAVTYMRGQWQSLVMVEIAPEQRAQSTTPVENMPSRKGAAVDASLAEDIKYGGLNHIVNLPETSSTHNQTKAEIKADTKARDARMKARQKAMKSPQGKLNTMKARFPGITDQQAWDIVHHTLFIGMTVAMLDAAMIGILGMPIRPDAVNNTYTSDGIRQQLVYGQAYVYVENGVVVAVQN